MNDYVSREEVLLIIENIKEDKSIPKNYGTLLDISRQVMELPGYTTNDFATMSDERSAL